MATSHALPAPPANGSKRPGPETNGAEAGTQALVPVPSPVSEKNPDEEPDGLPGTLSLLPVQLDVAIPARGFRVRNLLALEPGQVIETQWANGDDVPLASGAVQLAWSEFEVLETQLAVRITHLA